MMCTNIGSTNAAVLPLPVLAKPCNSSQYVWYMFSLAEWVVQSMHKVWAAQTGLSCRCLSWPNPAAHYNQCKCSAQQNRLSKVCTSKGSTNTFAAACLGQTLRQVTTIQYARCSAQQNGLSKVCTSTGSTHAAVLPLPVLARPCGS
jgi:hypothetical protein